MYAGDGGFLDYLPVLQTMTNIEFVGGIVMWFWLALGSAVFAALTSILAEKNIDAFNGAQGRILYVLWQEDGVPIKIISEKSGLAITSLTTMLERMEKNGLISRKTDEADKRKTLLFLTDKAKELKEAYDSVSNEMGNIYYRDFTDKEILQFEEYLNRIRVNLEEWSDK